LIRSNELKLNHTSREGEKRKEMEGPGFSYDDSFPPCVNWNPVDWEKTQVMKGGTKCREKRGAAN